MSIDRQEYRDAMAHLGAAVNIITSDGPAGRYGVTASAVFSVTDAPPTLAVCINRSSNGNAIFRKNGVLCVNTLSAPQSKVSTVFAGGDKFSQDERFGSADWIQLVTGAPALRGALVSFDCRISDLLEKGTHTIFFGEIAAVRQGASIGALVYFRRNYHQLGHDAAEAIASKASH